MGINYTLESFISCHFASLCAVASRFVDSATAEDITQDVLLKFWENREKYQYVKSIDLFLFVMVKNRTLNYIRNTNRQNNRRNEIPFYDHEDKTILNILIEEETNQIVISAINKLPHQSAQILRLTSSGYENKEIAELLNVSVNTIKTLKYGAIKKLKQYFISDDLSYCRDYEEL